MTDQQLNTEPLNGKLSDRQMQALDFTFADHLRVIGERDDLQKQNDRKEQMLTVAKIEIEGLRSELAAERSRTVSYQNERDQAVSNCAKYESFLAFIEPAIQKLREKPPETLG